MKININDVVKVKLTKYGHEILSEQYIKKSSDDCDFQLWELMNLFGQCLYMGNQKIPFEMNEIYIEEGKGMEKTKEYLEKQYKAYEEEFYTKKEKYQEMKKELETLQRRIDSLGGEIAEAGNKMDSFWEMLKETGATCT